MKITNILPLLFSIFLIINLPSCNTPRFTGQTVMHETSEAGKLSVIASGYGDLKYVSVKNGIQNAFRNILLNGIPGSNQSTPLLGKNAESAYKSNKKFLDNLIENGTDAFVLEQSNSKFKFFKINTPSSEVELVINLAGLRSHLEQNGIIREFGF